SPLRRQAAVWTVAYGLTMTLFLAATVSAAGWEATIAPYQFQLARQPEFGWTAYGYLLPESLADTSPLARAFRAGSVLGVVAILTWLAPGDLTGLLRRAVLVLLVFVTVQVFYSPQWLLWLLPFLLPLARRGPPAIALLIVALDLVTYMTFPLLYDVL